MKKLILASGSPRRRELLRQVGLEFEVITSECEEYIDSSDPEQTAASLSALKCRSVRDSIRYGKVKPVQSSDEGFLVIGSDTVVSINGSILGKPSGPDEAFEMLKMLSGNVHTVYTGVTICDTLSDLEITFTEHTDVRMFQLTDSEIKEYIDTGEPSDKAGAYGIQGKGAVLVEEIRGDYFTVVGLPVARLARELRKLI